jgi:hypothetical protein
MVLEKVIEEKNKKRIIVWSRVFEQLIVPQLV